MTRLTSRFYFLLSIFSVEARAAVIASATAKASQNVNQRADTPVPTFTLGNTDLYIPAEVSCL
jgi:hypothetical protein